MAIKAGCSLQKAALRSAGAVMQAGDGAKISGKSGVLVRALAPETEFLLFDLA